MSERWAIRLAERGVGGLAGLRRIPGIEVREEAGELWLRGSDPDEVLWRRLLGLPGAELFALLDDGQLIPHGCRVPRGRLPEGTWLPLPRWLGVKLEPAALPGRIAAEVELRLVPSTIERPAQVLLTPLETWTTFAQLAPIIRLQGLRFAVNESSDVVIHGVPLPPLPGVRYCEAEGVAVEAGWTWSPAVEAKLLAKLFGLTKNDLVLWHADGNWDHVRAGDFVTASRSAARLSMKERTYEQ